MAVIADASSLVYRISSIGPMTAIQQKFQKITLIHFEYGALLVFVAALPLFRALKFIAIAFYLLFWLMNRRQQGDWGGPWSRWESVTVLLIATAYLAILCGAFTSYADLPNGNDVLVYGLVFLAVRRSNYDAQQLQRVLAVAICTTMIAVLGGYWQLWVGKSQTRLQLHAVGYVNHTAIYIGIVLSAAFSWFLATWSRKEYQWLPYLGIAAAFLLQALFVAQARGAIVPATITIFMLLFVWPQRYRGVWKRTGVVAVLMTMLVMQLAPAIATRVQEVPGATISFRPHLARVAVLAIRESPFFGVGTGAFARITPQVTQSWQEKDGQWFEPQQLFQAPHAHNLYTNTFAERGLVGFIPLMAFLLLTGMAIYRARVQCRQRDELTDDVLWGAALGAWIMVVVGGMFNTTLHHEHALIAVILIALCLSRSRQRTSLPQVQSTGSDRS